MATTHARPEGITDYEWRQYLKDEEKFNKALLARVCPDCGGPLQKTLDPRPRGSSRAPEMWFNYRCANKACGFLLDQREGN